MEAWRIKQQIATTLVNLRRRRGLTQKALAEKMGVAQSTVTNVESGKGNPTIEVLTKFATYYQVPIHEFLWNSRTGIDVISATEFSNTSKLRVECRTIKPMETWEFELKYERQIIIKNKSGYALITANYFRGHEYLNTEDYYSIPGGGFINIKGIDEIPSELTIIELPRAEGR